MAVAVAVAITTEARRGVALQRAGSHRRVNAALVTRANSAFVISSAHLPARYSAVNIIR